MSAGAAEAAPQSQGFGGFRLGALQMALPMMALREVVPCSSLRPLPCPAACVVGAIALRGVVLPVVDVRLAVGQPAPPPSAESCVVVVVVEDGCLLGLLADTVTGVFHAPEAAISRMQLAGAGAGHALAAVLAGSVQLPDVDEAILLLSPAALARLPQVPLLVDPESGRQQLAGDDTLLRHQTQPLETARPLLLMRCAHMPLAIDAMAVHATLSDPKVQPSPLAMGHCRGVIAHDGVQLPLVDLLALCGLGRSDLPGKFQAVLMRLDAGLVAFAVDAVVDVVRVADGAVVPVSPLALPCPALFAGALPMAALSAEVVARAGTPARQFLLLDALGLQAHADLAGLAGTNTPVPDPGGSTSGRPRPPDAPCARPSRPMLTYTLAGDTATPVEQVAEILPFAPEAAVFGGMGALLGMVVNRGCAIPVLCLRRLSGLPSPPPTAALSVLVVVCETGSMGFAVPQLRSIEQAEWPLAPADAAPVSAVAKSVLQTRALARFGSGAQERLLPVLDLQQLARGLHADGLALAA